MAPDTGQSWGWEDTCAALTLSLQKNGLFHWGEIRDVVGEEAYGSMQWARRGNRVWVVDYSDIAPKPRRSMLDYAHVAGAELHGSGSNRHIMIEEPTAAEPGSEAPASEPTCSMVEMRVDDYELAHYVSHKTLNVANIGFVRDLMVSFRDRIVLDIERGIQRQVGDANNVDFAFVDDRKKKDRFAESPTSQDAMAAGEITNAAIRVVRKNPQIPFPHGLVCMLSPEQAMQLFSNSSVRMESMSAYGIDLVTSPAVKFGSSHERYMSVVASRRSIRVALSRIEVETARQKDGTVIKARYGMGVSVEPCMAAKIFSYGK